MAARRAPHVSPVPDGNLKDADWIGNIFLLPGEALKYSDQVDFRKWRTYTTAQEKFVDTTLGGNFAINCPPQYTRYADLKISGINAAHYRDGAKGRQYGMGRFYSEQMNDNQQLIHLSFGQAKYNGLITFFTGFYDADSALIAREGRGLDIAFRLGKIAGFVVTLFFWPILALGAAARFFFKRPSSKYYYFSGAMPLYWNRVQYIVDTLGVYMGLTPRIVDQNNRGLVDDDGGMADDKYRSFAHKFAPDIYDKDGSIIMYNVANKTARMALLRRDKLRSQITASEGQDAQAFFTGLQKLNEEFRIQDPGPQLAFNDYIKTWFESPFGNLTYAVEKPEDILATDVSNLNSTAQVTTASTQTPEEQAAAAAQAPSNTEIGTSTVEKQNQPGARAKIVDIGNVGKGTTHAQLASEYQNLTPQQQAAAAAVQNGVAAVVNEVEVVPAEGGILNGIASAFSSALKIVPGYGEAAGTMIEANAKGGADFVTFAVDFQPQSSESFSNNVKDSEIMNKINGITSSNASLRFGLADGQTGFGAADFVTKTARDAVAGFLEGISLGGLIALSGTAFTDVPKHYESSSANMGGSLTFNIPLRAWSGAPLCRMTQLLVPYAMVLAGALPISTGKQSFTGPFLCQLFSPGRFTGRLCMITDVSVSRGAGNVGWNNAGDMLGMDLSITVTSLDGYLHCGIDSGMGLFKWGKNIIDDDNQFNDYLSALSNLSVADQVEDSRRIAIAFTRKLQEIDSFFSIPRLSMSVGNFPPARVVGRLANFINGYTPNERTLGS